MFNVYAALVCLLLISSANGTTRLNDPKNCFRGPFESHEKWLNILTAKKKNFNEKAFLTRFPETKFDHIKSTLECRDFTYEVDGIVVEGYYLKPKDSDPRSVPVVIFNRGGNGSFGYLNFGSKIGLIADIALSGYIVIGSQYRGSSRGRIRNNGEDEFGGKDVNDVVALASLVQTIPEANPDNIALVGWSRGATQSYLASTQMPSVKAIIAIAGNADAERALAWRPDMEKVYQKRIPNFTENREAQLRQRSVIHWLDKLPQNAPILLMHGTEDKRVNVQQSIILAAALEANEIPHELVVFEGDNHGLRKNSKHVLANIQRWLSQYLK